MKLNDDQRGHGMPKIKHVSLTLESVRAKQLYLLKLTANIVSQFTDV